MPISHHSGSAVPDMGPYPAAQMMFLLEVTWWAHRTLWHLIYSGVMERHPTLEFVFTEQGTAWIPEELTRLDYYRGRLSGAAGALFLVAMFFSPLVTIVPHEAATPALIIVGFLMMTQIRHIDFTDYEIGIPAFLTMVLMPFTYSITNGVGAGFLYNDTTITFPRSVRGSYSFSSLANFLNGTYNNAGFTQTFGDPVVEQANPNAGFYVQDEWTAAPHLTFNAGIRYDLQFLETISPIINLVSPGSSMRARENIWRIITSICLRDTASPCNSYNLPIS